MTKKHPLSRFCVLAAGFVLAASNFGASAEDDGSAALDKVEITGSRIRRSEMEGPGPVLTLSRDDIERTGLTSLGDLLQELTVSGSALNTRFNSSGNFGFPPNGGGIGAGSTQVDLRNLGSNRVLVLVDGVRWVRESSASGVGGSTDLNTIPLSIVERVEVLKDGASAIYGSDAIAGVINIITRSNYQGFEANAYVGQFDEGDGETISVDASFGQTTARGSVFLSLSHTDQKRVAAFDREQAQFPSPGGPSPEGPGLTRGSAGTPQGRFVFSDNSGLQTNDNGTPGDTSDDFLEPVPGFDPTSGFLGVTQTGLNAGVCSGADTPLGAGSVTDGIIDTVNCSVTTPGGAVFPTGPAFPGDFIPFTNNERFNFAPFNLVLTPNERTSIYAQTNYELTDNITLYAKGLFNKRKSTNQAAPEPIFIGPGAGTGGLPDTVVVDATNPFNPFGVTFDPAGAGPLSFNFFGRRPIEFGPRIFEQDVNTMYVGAGLEGNFNAAGRSFFWDVNLVYSENRADQIKQGAIDARKLAIALGPVDECNADPACVPFNIFGGQNGGSPAPAPNTELGPGTITQEMIDFVGFTQKDVSEQRLRAYSANITGDIVELPAGPLSFAAGVETRREDGFFQPDAIVAAGDSNGIPANPTSGAYDVDEYYAELNIPLLAGKPWAELLDISVAARTSDYSTFGSDTNSKFGFRYRPNRQLLIRGTFAEGLRAPTIGELFGSQTRFDATLTDPCSAPIATAALAANCASLGVPAGFVQANPQISVFTGGNPDLEPETSDTITIGAVYSPSWVDNLSWADRFDFELTYYDIEVDDAIQAVDAQTQLDACVSTLDSAFCGGINRNATGAIAGFNNTLTNIGGVETSGYDFNVVYSSPEYSFGRIGVAWFNTFVDEFTQILLDPTSPSGFRERRLDGIEENDSAIAEWQSTMNVDWRKGPWNASWTLRHISDLTESCSDFLDGTPNSFTALGLCSDPDPNGDGNETDSLNKLGSTTYHDIQVTYSFTSLQLDVTLGVENAFDKEPPLCFSCSLNGYDASTYDVPGRFFYVRAGIEFQ